MLNNSFIGMASPNQAANDIYDAGKYNNNVNPFAPNVTGAILVMQGNITGNFDLTKTGTDLVILSSTNNTYHNTTVREGILQIGATNALPTGYTLSTVGSGVFDLNGYSQTVANISGGSGTIMDSGTSTQGDTLTVGNNTPANATYGGVITSNINVTKTGVSTLTLTGKNTYIGATAVNQGTLVVSGSISGTTNVNVASGATLAGGGSILTANNGSVTVQTGGSIAPSITSPLTFSLSGGSLDISGAVALANSQSLVFGLNQDAGQNSEVVVNTGNLNIGSSTLEFNDFQFFTLSPFTTPGTYTLFHANTPIIGTLGANTAGFVNGLQASIAIQGNDVILQVVPEPNSLALLASSVGVGLGLQRFRRRRRSA
jgi:autotransporter-associated beta strand protein